MSFVVNRARRRALATIGATLAAGPATQAMGAQAAPAPPPFNGAAAEPPRTRSVIEFGARGDGSADDGDALRQAVAWASGELVRTGGLTPRLHVPAGRYRYARPPNFAVTNLQVDCAPGVTFHHVGEGPALLLDAGETSDGVFQVQLTGKPTVQGNARSTYGIDVRALHHSLVTASVRDVALAALRTRWAVSTEFQLRTTGLGVGGNNPAPLDGIVLDRRKPGEDTAACLFHLPIVEQVRNIGIRLTAAGNCTFISGTSEANGVGGLHVAAGSTCNLFMGLDLEFNGTFGILCEGNRNSFISVFDDKLATFAGTGNRVQGNQFNAVVNRGVANSFETVGYAAAGGAFLDDGVDTRKSLVRNLSTGKLDRDLLCSPGSPIGMPAGGTVQDIQARTALAALLAQLKAAGVIA